ncbi:MAG: hypothetical protein WAM28_02690 [Chlamydiales bacterium]
METNLLCPVRPAQKQKKTKHAKWVKMLKEMPDIRPDKIKAALEHKEPPDINAIIAQKLL